MSRLILLQGISGTGKTSLPRAFAEAAGGEAELVAVQAGWRDKHDLLGHYNAFEGRYYESDFLRALYKAQTPAYQNRPFFIVLDEMNLSHPEQYFADFIHALEVTGDERAVTLLSDQIGDPPDHIVQRDGRLQIEIPDNVWFVGTANHDETTVDFADKTYDRSHVLELPRQRESFEPGSWHERDPLKFSALDQSFEDARSTHDDAAERVTAAFEELDEVLGKQFDVGWGNRLHRQIEDYAPVVVAAGGTTGEAADRLLARKVLRKVQDRFDTTREDFEELEADIEESWDKHLNGSAPVKSKRIVEREKKRL